MSLVSLSIITPVYNEEDGLAEALNANLAVADKWGIDYEVVVVNDGSTDGSAKLVDELYGEHPKVLIYHKEQNEGMGSAFRKGVELATKEHIICVPADSPLNNEVFEAFMNHIGKADVLVSYRIERVGYNWWMKMNSWVFHQLVSWLFGMNLRDYNWIHLYRRRIFDAGKVTIESNRLFMLAEILIKAKRLGFSFAEFPVQQNERLTGIASASRLSNVIKTLYDLLYFRLFR